MGRELRAAAEGKQELHLALIHESGVERGLAIGQLGPLLMSPDVKAAHNLAP